MAAADMISPHATVPRQDRLDRVLIFLDAQFGDAVTRLKDGVEIRVDNIESHVAKLDFDTMQVECKWEPLDSRVKQIVKRALGVVAPLGRGGVIEDGDLMAEMEEFAQGSIKLEDGNDLVKMEDDE